MREARAGAERMIDREGGGAGRGHRARSRRAASQGNRLDRVVHARGARRTRRHARDQDMRPTHGALGVLLAQRVGALVAHAHVPARQAGGVHAAGQADDAGVSVVDATPRGRPAAGAGGATGAGVPGVAVTGGAGAARDLQAEDFLQLVARAVHLSQRGERHARQRGRADACDSRVCGRAWIFCFSTTTRGCRWSDVSSDAYVVCVCTRSASVSGTAPSPSAGVARVMARHGGLAAPAPPASRRTGGQHNDNGEPVGVRPVGEVLRRNGAQVQGASLRVVRQRRVQVLLVATGKVHGLRGARCNDAGRAAGV